MIQKPEQMDFTKKPFTVIVSGSPGLGKTTLALSAPNPILFDLDDGVSRVQAQHRRLTSVVDSYDALLSDMTTDEYRDAESIIIDTGGSLVQLMKGWAKQQDPKAARDGRAMFGVIKQAFADLNYQIKNKDGKNLIVVFHTTEMQKGDQTVVRLSCEGSAKDIVWTPADFGGHMFMMGNRRMIGFTPTDEYFAKGCYGMSGIHEVPTLAEGHKNTFLTDLFKKARSNIALEMETYAPKRSTYNAAMEIGNSIISRITTPASANDAIKALAEVEHALTSKSELSTALRVKAKAIGIVWDKEANTYVQGDAKSA